MEENIVRTTLEEALAYKRAGVSRSDWDRIGGMTEEEIERLAKEDNALHGFTDEDLDRAVPAGPPAVK